jgi:hypothetical protein
VAAEAGHTMLFEKLVAAHATKSALSRAISHAFVAERPPSILMKRLKISFGGRCCPDLDAIIVHHHTPVRLALLCYPDCAQVMRIILSRGTPTRISVAMHVTYSGPFEEKVSFSPPMADCSQIDLYSDRYDNSDEEEATGTDEVVSDLSFACSLVDDRHVSSDVLEVLLKAGSDSPGTLSLPYTLTSIDNVNFQAPNSQPSALYLACGFGKPNLVRTLLLNKADASVRDVNGWSALTHATRSGDVEAVKVLT